MKRRSFLGYTAMFLGGLALAPAVSLAGVMQRPSLRRVAVIGLGPRGRDFLNALLLQQGGASTLLAVCDVETNRRKVSEGSIERYADLGELLRNFSPQLCYLATPDHHHAAMIAAVCRAGSEVLVDAPLALTLQDLEMLESSIDAWPRIWLIDELGARFRKSWSSLASPTGPVRRVVLEHRTWHTAGAQAAKVTPPPAGLDWEAWRGAQPGSFDDRILRDWRERRGFAISPLGGEALGAFAFILETLGFSGPSTIDAAAALTSRAFDQRSTPQGGHYLPDQEEYELRFPEGRTVLWRRGSLRSPYPRPDETSVIADGVRLGSYTNASSRDRLPVVRALGPDLFSGSRLALVGSGHVAWPARGAPRFTTIPSKHLSS